MENYFRNLTVTFWEMWIIQSRAMIYQSFDLFLACRPLTWHTTTFCEVTTIQLSNGTVHTFQKMLRFMKIHLLLLTSFIIRQVRAKFIMHAFMIEFDETDY